MFLCDAAVWLDHAKANLFLFSPDELLKYSARSSSPRTHVHPKRGSIDPGDPGNDRSYFQHFVVRLSGASAKLKCFKHIGRHHH